jgi:hypothetical protein
MNIEISKKYSTHSTALFLELLHNNKDFNTLFVKEYPELEGPATSFFADENCGCKPRLLVCYRNFRFHIDLMIINYIQSNPDCIDLDDFFETNYKKDLSKATFAIDNTESDYNNFLATANAKSIDPKGFSTTVIGDKILITFF